MASVTFLPLFSPAHAQRPPAPPDEEVARCEAVASRAACDPEDGYIAGPDGPCAPSDLDCVRDRWREVGDPRSFPDLGVCGTNHEDGGALVPCPDDGGGDGAAPPPPPPPPTPDEARATCPRPPRPTLHVDPDPEGLAGMETYLWADPHAARSATTTVRGYPVTCTITPQRWRWETDDSARYSRAGPGAPPPSHAAAHVYERSDTYTLRLTVRWAVRTNYGDGTRSRSTTRTYPVGEVRGVLEAE